MKLFFAADHDLALLPFFLSHYKKLGFTDFYCSSTNTGLQSQATFLPEGTIQLTVVEHKRDDKLSHFHSIFQAFFKLVEHNIGQNEWYGITELDEFFDFPESAQSIIDKCNKGNYDAVYGQLVDRVTIDGSLPELKSWIPLEEQFPRTSNISEKIIGSCLQKVLLVKGKKNIGGGNHNIMNGCHIYYQKFNVWHMKWHSNILKRCNERVKLPHDDGEGWKIGNQNFLNHWDKYHSVIV